MAIKQLTSYSFLDVNASIVGPGGSFAIGQGAGIADEGISIEMADDKDTMIIGADGTPMHSLHAGQGGTATIRLLKISGTNNMLSTMYDLQTASSSLWGQNTIIVSNIASGDVTTCLLAAFRRQPNNSYGKDGALMEWAFNVGRIYQLLGAGSITT